LGCRSGCQVLDCSAGIKEITDKGKKEGRERKRERERERERKRERAKERAREREKEREGELTERMARQGSSKEEGFLIWKMGDREKENKKKNI
jgi:centrosomal protein CEP76